MPPQRQDYLLSLIGQAAAALKRLRERLSANDAAAEIFTEAQATESALLGQHAAVLRVIDSRSAAGLLADPRRIALWADLLMVQAEALRRLGRGTEAVTLDARARALGSTPLAVKNPPAT